MISRALVSLVLLYPCYAIANDDFRLRYDPFERKAAAVVKTPNASASGGDSDRAQSELNDGAEPNSIGRSTIKANSWGAQIRGIVYGGRNSVVNVDGQMVTINDEYDGYTLKHVEERRAVFVKNGNEFVLSLDELEGEELEDHIR